eukprot:ANDGO_06317.mRNA.1 hypothetical protein
MTSLPFTPETEVVYEFFLAIREICEAKFRDVPEVFYNPRTFIERSGWGRKFGYSQDASALKRRYFSLVEKEVLYFASDSHAGKTKKAKGTIKLDSFTTCFRVNMGEPLQLDALAKRKGSAEGPNGLRIRVPSECRSYYIFFDQPEDRDFFHDGICFNIEKIRTADETFIECALKHLANASEFIKLEKDAAGLVTRMKCALRLRMLPFKPAEEDNGPQACAFRAIRLGKYDIFQAEFVSHANQDLDPSEYILGGTTYLLELISFNLRSETALSWFLDSYDVNVNQPHHVTKDTALLRAVQIGHVELVKILLSYGADVNLANKFGESPMSEAYVPEIQALLRTPPASPPKRTGAKINHHKMMFRGSMRV